MSALTKGVDARRGDLIVTTLTAAYLLTWVSSLQQQIFVEYILSTGIPALLEWIAWVSLIPALLVGGIFLDRVRKRKPFFSLLFLGVFSFVPLIHRSNEIAFVYLLVSAISTGLITPAIFSFFIDNTRVYKRGRAVGAIASVWGIFIVIQILTASNSLDAWFATLGIEAVVIALIGLLITKEKDIFREWRSIPIKKIISERNLVLFAVAALAMGLSTRMLEHFLDAYATVLSMDISSAYFIIALVWVFLASFFGFVYDRMGRKPLIVIGTLLYASSFMLFVAFSTAFALWLTVLLLGIVHTVIYFPAIFVIFGDLSLKETRGRVYGVGLASIFGGSFVGEALGSVLERSSSSVVVTLPLFISFIIIITVMMAHETLPPKEEAEEIRDYIRSIEHEVKKDEETIRNDAE